MGPEEIQLSLYILRIGETGVTWIDLLLVTLCPLAGLLGTIVGSEMQKKQIRKSLSEDAYIERAGKLTELSDYNTEKRHTHDMKDASLEEDIKGDFSERVIRKYDEFVDRRCSLATKGNWIIGIALGFVVSLYFFGAITQDMTSLARVVGLSILLGYQAPNIWRVQEKVLSDLVERKLVEAIQNATKNKNT